MAVCCCCHADRLAQAHRVMATLHHKQYDTFVLPERQVGPITDYQQLCFRAIVVCSVLKLLPYILDVTVWGLRLRHAGNEGEVRSSLPLIAESIGLHVTTFDGLAEASLKLCRSILVSERSS